MASLTIGIDLGGTKLAAALVDQAGTIVAERRWPQTPRGYEATLEALASLVRELSDVAAEAGAQVEAAGVAVAAFLDVNRRRVVQATILGWRDKQLADDLGAITETPIRLLNDADAAAWGEYVHGGGEGSRSLLVVTVGTGVGGGIVLDGNLLTGGTGVGCEIGHLTVEYRGLQCLCGGHGCLEMYASGTALARIAAAACRAAPADAELLLAQAGGDVSLLTGEHVVAAARLGDPTAQAAINELSGWLGRGLAQAATVLDPALILIGGGVASAGEMVLSPVRQAFRAGLGASDVRPLAPIALATLGPSAGVIGAAAYARQSA